MESEKGIRITSIFYISYIIMLFGWMFEKVSFIENFLPYIRIFSYLMLSVIIFSNYQKFTLKKILVNIFVTIVVILSSIKSDSNMILALWLFILSCEHVEFKKIVKVDFYTKIIFTIIIILLYFMGFTNNNTYYSYTGVVRSSLGFGNPNTFGYYIFSICADYIFLKGKRISIFNVIIFFAIALIVSKISLSRTSSLLIILMSIVAYFSKGIEKITLSRFTKNIMILLFLFFTISTYLISINYDSSNKAHNKINQMTSGRIAITNRVIKEYQIKFLGQEVELYNYNKSYKFYLDNAYIKLLISYGICCYLLIYAIYIRAIKKATLEKKPFIIAILFIYMVYGLSENVMFWLTGNLFLLYPYTPIEKKH